MKDQKIKLGSDIEIHLPKLVDTKLLIQANSGGGKSWAIRRILEQSHGKVQHIILDPEGEFSTLREKYEYILAGKGQDAPVDTKSAAMLARKLLELKVSAVVDLYELHPQDRKKFVRLFLESMINAPKELWRPVLVVIDEAHTFAPEKGESEALSAVIGLASLGRKRGFGVVMATQRISKLHKDAAAECNNKLIGRTGLDIDRKRAAEEIGFTSKEDVLSLRTLEPGEFYAFGPAISMDVIKRRVGDVKTSHPIAGKSFTEVAPPTDRIKKMLGQLADLPAEAKREADTIQSLKSELSVLKRQPAKSSEVDIKKAVDMAVRQEQKKTEQEIKAKDKTILELRSVISNAAKILNKHLNISPEVFKKTEFKIEIEPKNLKPKPVYKDPEPLVDRNIQDRGGDKIKADMLDNGFGSTYTISGPEQRILDAIAWLNSVGIEQPEATAVAFLANYTIGGGGFNNPKGSLRSKGLIEYVGSCLVLTKDGRSLANTPDETLSVEELHNRVLQRLPGPEQRVLKPLLEAYPNDLSNEELAEKAVYQVGSGGFNNPKGRLRSLGLITYLSGGRVKAADVLFPNI